MSSRGARGPGRQAQRGFRASRRPGAWDPAGTPLPAAAALPARTVAWPVPVAVASAVGVPAGAPWRRAPPPIRPADVPPQSGTCRRSGTARRPRDPDRVAAAGRRRGPGPGMSHAAGFSRRDALTLGGQRVLSLATPAGITLDDALARIRAVPGVARAQADAVRHATAFPFVKMDPP